MGKKISDFREMKSQKSVTLYRRQLEFLHDRVRTFDFNAFVRDKLDEQIQKEGAPEFLRKDE